MDLQSVTSWLAAFFNSVFFTSVAGALAGAFAGAYGAQRIAERSKYRDQLLKEMRDTNTAIMVAFGIANSLLTMKDQHIKSLKENFESQRQALLEFHKKRNAGQIPRDKEFSYNADLQTLSLPPLPTDILQKQVFEKLSLVGRPLSLTTTLSQTAHGLSALLEKRNQLIELYKAGKPPLTAPLYFGLRQGDHVNEDYPSSIRGIYNQTDDIIYFSRLLCKDLVEHGNQLAAEFNKRFGRGVPSISEPEFSRAETLGLMPNADNYADWVTMFKRAQPSANQNRAQYLSRWIKNLKP